MERFIIAAPGIPAVDHISSLGSPVVPPADSSPRIPADGNPVAFQDLPVAQQEKEFLILDHHHLVRMDRSGGIRRGGKEEPQQDAEHQIPGDRARLHRNKCYERTSPESIGPCECPPSISRRGVAFAAGTEGRSPTARRSPSPSLRTPRPPSASPSGRTSPPRHPPGCGWVRRHPRSRAGPPPRPPRGPAPR